MSQALLERDLVLLEGGRESDETILLGLQVGLALVSRVQAEKERTSIATSLVAAPRTPAVSSFSLTSSSSLASSTFSVRIARACVWMLLKRSAALVQLLRIDSAWSRVSLGTHDERRTHELGLLGQTLCHRDLLRHGLPQQKLDLVNLVLQHLKFFGVDPLVLGQDLLVAVLPSLVVLLDQLEMVLLVLHDGLERLHLLLERVELGERLA